MKKSYVKGLIFVVVTIFLSFSMFGCYNVNENSKEITNNDNIEEENTTNDDITDKSSEEDGNMNKFSYRPYRADESKYNYDLMIVRVAPKNEGVVLEWLGETNKEFIVKIYQGDILAIQETTTKNEIEITGLDNNVEYSAVISTDSEVSDSRLFVPGDYLYPVINYYNPNDHIYDFGGNFLGSPHIIRYKGELFCSMDTFKNGGTSTGHKQTLIFKSSDEGETWHYLSEVVPAEWGRFINVNDELYFLGTVVGKGVIIYKTTDGINFERGDIISPINNNSNGGYFGCTPTQMLVKDDYVYFVGGQPYYLDNVAYSSLTLAKGSIKDGLLNSSSWTFSNTLEPDPEWNTSVSNHHYAEESNVIEKDGEIYILSRYFTRKALMTHYNQKENKLEFYKVIDLEIGYCKFYIEKNEDDGYYYAMGNHHCFPRLILKLYRSKDLENWEYVKTINDLSMLDADLNGIQYPSYIIENNVALTVIRTALNGSDTFHNSNAVTFAKISLK